MLGRASAGLLACLLALTALIVLADGPPGEEQVLRQLSAGQLLDPLWRRVDTGTGYRPMAVAAAALVTALVVLRRQRDALRTAVSFAGAVAVTTLLKRLVQRPRPEDVPAWAEVSTFSYPSGHATATAAVAAAVVLITRGSGRGRWAAAALVVVAACAQLGAGLHFPSDLLAGWLVAAACATAAWASAAPGPRSTDEA